MSDDKRPKLGLVASGNFGNKPNVDKQSEDYIKLSIADAREMLDELEKSIDDGDGLPLFLSLFILNSYDDDGNLPVSMRTAHTTSALEARGCIDFASECLFETLSDRFQIDSPEKDPA